MIVPSEQGHPRPEGYGAKLKDHFTGAQKRRPAEATRNYRDNFDTAFAGVDGTPSNPVEKQEVSA